MDVKNIVYKDVEEPWKKKEKGIWTCLVIEYNVFINNYLLTMSITIILTFNKLMSLKNLVYINVHTVKM